MRIRAGDETNRLATMVLSAAQSREIGLCWALGVKDDLRVILRWNGRLEVLKGTQLTEIDLAARRKPFGMQWPQLRSLPHYYHECLETPENQAKN